MKKHGHHESGHHGHERDHGHGYEDERRRHSRFPVASLQVTLTLTGRTNFYSLSYKVHSMDFNRYGMAVRCPHRFNLNDVVALSIRHKQFRLDQVLATIVNRIEMGEEQRYGLRFEVPADKELLVHQEEMLEALEQMIDSGDLEERNSHRR